MIDSKILVMGLARAGKSSILKVVVEGVDPKDTTDYKATLHYEKRDEYIYKGEHISIFDLGGQIGFLDHLTKDDITKFLFTNVLGFIFVVDSEKGE